ncbi:MAG: AP2 domain-containing protein [Verrucomicrobiota bacterium]
MVASRPNYGITRIDQPEKKNHGFYVRITHRGKSHQKYFPDKASGGKTKALKAAKEHRDKLLSKMPKYKQEAAAKKKRRIKQSGVVGVTHVVSKSPKDKTYEYWQAAWVDGDNKRKTAKFSIKRYGNDKALEMAKKARRAGIRGKR